MHTDAAKLKVVIPAAAKDLSRVALTGVQFRKDGEMVTTDGHVLVRHKAGITDAEDLDRESITVPMDSLKAAMKLAGKMPIGVDRIPETGKISINAAGTVVEGEDLEPFPNWKPVIPKRKAKVTIGFMPGVLEQIVKIAKAEGGSLTHIKLEIIGPEEAVRFSIGHEVEGVAMPCRLPETDD